jgi:predicted lipoprotein with Yx(FWY)xxD motif
MRKSTLTVIGAFIAAGILAATAFASASKPTVALHKTKVGNALVAANGHTVYLFTADKGSKSACYEQCAGVWPPLIAARPTAGAGLKASKLGTTKRSDGKLQVTYGGHPLYYFAPDKKAGDVNGQGVVHFGGAWWLVSSAGAKITSKP